MVFDWERSLLKSHWKERLFHWKQNLKKKRKNDRDKNMNTLMGKDDSIHNLLLLNLLWSIKEQQRRISIQQSFHSISNNSFHLIFNQFKGFTSMVQDHYIVFSMFLSDVFRIVHFDDIYIWLNYFLRWNFLVNISLNSLFGIITNL